MKTKRKDDGGIIFTGNGEDEEKRGTDMIDFFYGNGGDDTFHGEAGNDELYGGGRDDKLYGGDDDDIIRGWKGNDTLKGGAGNDELRGGMGKDTFVYDSKEFGQDTIEDFQIGKDKLKFEGAGLSLADLEITEEPGDTTDAVDTVIEVRETGSTITLKNIAKSDLMDNFVYHFVELSGIYGTSGDDNEETGNKLTGDGESNKIFGLAGDDELAGGAGKDELYGGDGDDKLSGDAGNDTLRGGSGKDTFFYGSTEFGRDTIRDFKIATDGCKSRMAIVSS